MYIYAFSFISLKGCNNNVSYYNVYGYSRENVEGKEIEECEKIIMLKKYFYTDVSKLYAIVETLSCKLT